MYLYIEIVEFNHGVRGYLPDGGSTKVPLYFLGAETFFSAIIILYILLRSHRLEGQITDVLSSLLPSLGEPLTTCPQVCPSGLNNAAVLDSFLVDVYIAF